MLDEIGAARLRRDIDAINALYLEGGWPLLTGWMRRIIRDAPHPDLRRVELLDTQTMAITTWSGMVGTVSVDPAEPCTGCLGMGRIHVPGIGPLQPCGGCLGTGLAAGQRGSVAAAPPCRSCGQQVVSANDRRPVVGAAVLDDGAGGGADGPLRDAKLV